MVSHDTESKVELNALLKVVSALDDFVLQYYTKTACVPDAIRLGLSCCEVTLEFGGAPNREAVMLNGKRCGFCRWPVVHVPLQPRPFFYCANKNCSMHGAPGRAYVSVSGDSTPEWVVSERLATSTTALLEGTER